MRTSAKIESQTAQDALACDRRKGASGKEADCRVPNAAVDAAQPTVAVLRSHGPIPEAKPTVLPLLRLHERLDGAEMAEKHPVRRAASRAAQYRFLQAEAVNSPAVAMLPPSPPAHTTQTLRLSSEASYQAQDRPELVKAEVAVQP